ncbi:Uncharacterized protein ChrSV_3366 [Chromobacterium vaccinii]|nr:Uncharacterized protein ChrSW_3366 [Chromobacterium vaccinii]QND90823.1 Uncharacterized protein ChrSV_3366 [Chromobacterium vaccinii]
MNGGHYDIKWRNGEAWPGLISCCVSNSSAPRRAAAQELPP